MSTESVCFDLDLIRRYDGRGPRYTSYPTALQFGEQLTAEDYIANARASNASGVPLSLYVHIPFCESLCPFCCFHRVLLKRPKADRYFEALRKEIRSYKDAGFDFVDVCFQVIPDPQRPFTVNAGLAEATVLGTAFNVYRTEDSTEVTVTEGVVRVTERGTAAVQRATSNVLRANEQVVATADGLFDFVAEHLVEGSVVDDLLHQATVLLALLRSAHRTFDGRTELRERLLSRDRHRTTGGEDEGGEPDGGRSEGDEK